jgi:hypothetical protein
MGEAYSPIGFRKTYVISERTGPIIIEDTFRDKAENLLTLYAKT